MRGMPNLHKASVAQAVDGEQPAPAGPARSPRRPGRVAQAVDGEQPAPAGPARSPRRPGRVAQAVDGEQPAPGHRRLPRRAWRRDAIALAGLLTACALTAVRMRGLIVRPLWFDESWRAWHLTGPSLTCGACTHRPHLGGCWPKNRRLLSSA